MLTSFRKDRLLSAKNFSLYYGYGKMKELSLFDIAIVDPNGLKHAEFEQLRLTNTLMITYLSVLEVHPYEPIFQELSRDDFILVDGEPLQNDVFGTYLVSLKSKKWVQHLLNRIEHQLRVLESDGLFLDTIGDIEMPMLSSRMKQQQAEGAVNLLAALKMLYPHHVFIQNNGLEMVLDKTASYIDGVCWENPPVTLKESDDWVQIMLRKLSKFKDEHHLKMFLLIEDTVEKERNAYQQARKLAKKLDFLFYYAAKDYVDGFNVSKG